MTENEFLSRSHMSLGMWIRNHWGLWKGSRLSKYFHSIGIYHPDDMSGIILTCFYRQLQHKDWELDKQVKYYQDYWAKTTEHLQKLKTDTAYQQKQRLLADSLVLADLIKTKSEWPPGTFLTGYLDYDCRILPLGKRTKVKGKIVEWRDEKIILLITEYYDRKRKNRVIKCNNIQNDTLVVDFYQGFDKEE